MTTRRQFVIQTGALLASGANPRLLGAAEAEPLPVAAIVTEYRPNSHADVIVGKILEGFDRDGGAGPALRLVGLYTDQVPANDLSRELADKHGFHIARTIEEAITLGGDEIAVAGVLSIGEHGRYPFVKATQQKKYPRRRFFDEITAVFRKYGRVVPVFNDKHLAYAWRDAKHMYDTAREMEIPFLAGSALPVTWRTPELTLPRRPLTGAIGVGTAARGVGGLESYGFHALEMLQCMVERRRGGETGVRKVQAVRGNRIARMLEVGRWSRELLDAAVAATPTPEGGRPDGFDSDALFFLINYRDGLEVAVAMNTGMTTEFAFAAQIRGRARPSASWFRLQGWPHGHFSHLLRAIEYTIHTARPAYPVERTLLTTGMLDALMHSAANGDRAISTPQLAIRYDPANWPFAPGVPLA